MGQVCHGLSAECAAVGLVLLCQKLVQKLRDPRLVIVADGQIDGGIGSDPLGIGLHIAAHRDDDRLGIALFGLVDHLAALSVGNVGDRTGVDHIDVRLFFKGHNTVAGFFHFLPHNVQFIAVHFASEVVKCSTFQIFFLF